MIAVVDVVFFLVISGIVLLLASLVVLLGKRFPQWQLSGRIVLFCAGCAIFLAAVLPRLLLSWANVQMTVVILFACAVGGAWAAAKLPECAPVMSEAAASPGMVEPSILSLPVSEKQQKETPAVQAYVEDKQEKTLPKKEAAPEKPLATRKKKAPKVQKKEPAGTGASTAGEELLPTKPKQQAPARAKRREAVAFSTAMKPVESVTARMPEAEPEKTATTAAAVAAVAAKPIAVAGDLPAVSAIASSSLENSKGIYVPEKLGFAEKTEEIPAAFASVDACLEEAWHFREAGSWQTAQKVLQMGICQFADDEELPFLLIEEGALLKRYGRWEEAIAALEAALALPQVRRQPMWQKDIQQAFGYLQIFLGVLRQLKLETAAPEAIPAFVLEEVEAIFQQWRSQR